MILKKRLVKLLEALRCLRRNMKIIHGDCFDEIKKIDKCRLLLTDIPYGEVNRDSNGLRNLDKYDADNTTFELMPFLDLIYDKADIFIIFCGNKQYSTIYTFFYNKQKAHKGTVRQIIWAKSNPSPMNGEYVYLSGTENAVWFKKSKTGKLNCKCKKNYIIAPTGSSKYHLTEKNHKLLTELILDNTNVGDTVLDCCMGSGSTGICALKNGRDFVGIELNKEYYEIAKKRIGGI